MEQKKILWVTFIIGIFLLIVIGVALILYTQSEDQKPVMASLGNQSDIWVKPVETIPQPISSVDDTELQQQQLPDVAVTQNSQNATMNVETMSTETIQAESITVNTLDVRTITGTLPLVPASDTVEASNTASPVVPEIATNKSATAVVTTSVVPQKQKSTPTQKKSVAPKKSANPIPAKAESKKTTQSIRYWIQAASFTDKLKAESARSELGKRLISPNIFTSEQDGTTYYRVRVGPYTTQKEAEYWLGQLKSIKGFEKSYITQTVM